MRAANLSDNKVGTISDDAVLHPLLGAADNDDQRANTSATNTSPSTIPSVTKVHF